MLLGLFGKFPEPNGSPAKAGSGSPLLVTVKTPSEIDEVVVEAGIVNIYGVLDQIDVISKDDKVVPVAAGESP